MYDHKRTASWSDTPHSFPGSQRTKHGPSSEKVFSQFLLPSGAPERPMHTLPKASTTVLYDDPAFSPDPRTHPYFAANITPWATPFQLQSGFIAQPGLLHPDTDEAQLLQPHNTPMFSDDHSSTTHETNSSSNHTSTSFASLSTPPTSADSHSSPWTSATPEKLAQPLPWPPETQQKKKINLAMFWRKSPPETILEPVNSSQHVLPDPTPSQLPPVDRPTPARFVSMPEAMKPLNRPTLPPRSATTAADSKPPPTASHRIIGGVAIRGHELDRIDELDESNPMGLPLHHGGPYEAITQKAPDQQANQQNVPHNIGSQYQVKTPSVHKPNVDQRSHGYKAPGPISVPIIPAGVSIKLEPGQILPRNFYQQLNPNPSRSTESSDAPQWLSPHSLPSSQRGISGNKRGYQWQANVENLTSAHNLELIYLDGKKHPGHEQNALPEYSLYPTDMTVQNQFPVYDGTRDGTKRSKRHSYAEGSQYHGPPQTGGQAAFDFRAPTPLHRTPSNPRLPPRMQALQMQNSRPDESHRRSPKPHHSAQEYGASHMEATPDQTVRRHRSLAPGQVPQVPHMDADQSLPQISNTVISSRLEAPRLPDQQLHSYHTAQNAQRRDPGSESSHRFLSTSASAHPGSSGFIPPSHVPKRLIMPAPLQQPQPLAPRLQSEPPPGQMNFSAWQPHLRTSSDTTNIQMAKDAALPQSGKLRKRNSVQGVIPQTPYISPYQPLTFEPTSLYTSAISPQPAPSNRKLEKAPKKVLSKRRTDV